MEPLENKDEDLIEGKNKVTILNKNKVNFSFGKDDNSISIGNSKELKWWKDKLCRVMDRVQSCGVILNCFSKEEEKKIYEECKKWRNKK